MSNQTKSALRKLMSDNLKALSKEDIRRQSEEVLKQLIELPQYKRAQRISLYLSTEQEIDTVPLLRHALEVDQKQCYVPFVDTNNLRESTTNAGPNGAPSGNGHQRRPTTRMLMLKLDSMRQYEELARNRWGIKEFSATQEDLLATTEVALPPDGLNLMIVPGVAFTRDGHRLGHGKGYYDEFLLDWSIRCAPVERNRFFTVGLSLREQIVEDDQLPRDASDFRLDKMLFASSLSPESNLN